MVGTCSVPICNRPRSARGYCDGHYQRLRDRGDVLADKPLGLYIGKAPRPIADRLHERTDRSGGPDSCWPWTGTRLRSGYGTIGIGSLTDGSRRNELTHRVAWMVAVGPIPEGGVICHRCDNPPCVNPAHLFLGTHTDNHRDMEAKGRANYSGVRKRTTEEVSTIRTRAAAGERISDIARSMGIPAYSVGRIVRGRTY